MQASISRARESNRTNRPRCAPVPPMGGLKWKVFCQVYDSRMSVARKSFQRQRASAEWLSRRCLTLPAARASLAFRVHDRVRRPEGELRRGDAMRRGCAVVGLLCAWLLMSPAEPSEESSLSRWWNALRGRTLWILIEGAESKDSCERLHPVRNLRPIRRCVPADSLEKMGIVLEVPKRCSELQERC